MKYLKLCLLTIVTASLLFFTSTERAIQATSFLSVGIGASDVDLPGNDFSNDWDNDTFKASRPSQMTHPSLQLAAGYLFHFSANKFQIGPQISLTASPGTTWNYKLTDTTSKSYEMKYSRYHFDIVAKGKYNINPMFSMHAILGMAFVTQKRTYAGTEGTLPSKDGPVPLKTTTAGKTLPEFGFGFSIDFPQRYGFNLDLIQILGDTINVEDVFDKNPKTNTANYAGGTKVAGSSALMLGAHYYF